MTTVYWVAGILLGLILYVKVFGRLARYITYYVIYYPKSLAAKIFFPISPLFEEESPFVVEESIGAGLLKRKFKTFGKYYKSRGSLWGLKIFWPLVICLIYAAAVVSWLIRILIWFVKWLFDIKKKK
jgi:hypothetical protein